MQKDKQENKTEKMHLERNQKGTKKEYTRSVLCGKRINSSFLLHVILQGDSPGLDTPTTSHYIFHKLQESYYYLFGAYTALKNVL